MHPVKAWFFFLVLPVSGSVLAAYDANGVALGATEKEVKKAFPSAYCKALEWSSSAADRRCDDARISFGGAEARITFYLKKDAVQAFDLRFNTSDLDKIVAHVKARYGKPVSEVKDAIEKPGAKPRETLKALWESGADRAVLVAQLEKKRAALTVSRGNWEDEIYRVR